MPKRRVRAKFIWWPIFGLLIIGIGFATLVTLNRPKANQDMAFGVTYSIKYAKELGLDWQETYDQIINELQVKKIRLPIYWSDLEPLPNRYDFRKYDYMISRAEETDTELIVVVGRRVPRWPECHEPPWIASQVEAFKQEKILTMVETVVKRYKGSPSIVSWQVDNEPLLSVFGECPPPDEDFLREEINLVRSLDATRPVTISESGELSTWLRGSQLGDWLGISMYRVTWNKYFGYWYYPLSPNFYRRKAQLISPLVDRVIITELQAEPWSTEVYITELSLEEQGTSMDLKRFRRNLEFARLTGFDEAYLWGVEWWYWLKTVHGDARMWQEAKQLWSD